jgi:ribose-phosphate pyrophosphokinase
MKIFTGSNNNTLSQKISNSLQFLSNGYYTPSFDNLKIEKFSDGEILPLFTESVRNQDVYFIQSLISSDAIMETLLVSDAAKRAGCQSFNLISPYMGYSRQDKTDHLRSSIGSKVIADIFEKIGVNNLFTIDLHASSIQGFYNIPVIHLNGNKIFIDYLKDLNISDLCIVAPDQGAVKRASDYCKAFPDSTFAMINKKRTKPNEVHSMELVGDVRDKNVVIVDDIADTLGTLKKASELVKDMGAKSVRAICTHGILSSKAIKNLEESPLIELLVSDSIESVIDKATRSNKLRVVTCANLLAKTVIAVHQKKSVHEINII